MVCGGTFSVMKLFFTAAAADVTASSSSAPDIILNIQLCWNTFYDCDMILCIISYHIQKMCCVWSNTKIEATHR